MEIFYDQSQTISITKLFNGVLDNGNGFSVIGTHDSHQWFAESVMYDVYSDKTEELENMIIERFEEDMNNNN